MNPSFKPPPPVSDSLRTVLYEEFMRDPVNNNVRALSQRYHLSLKRVDAILRLKGMEKAWIKGKTLQTGFRDGMEKILGVEPFKQPQSLVNGRYDAHEADTLEQEERRDASRQRYQRLYWESVPEDGREPIVPASLEQAKIAAKRFAQAAEDSKSNEKLMPRIRDTAMNKAPKSKVQIVTKPGRPTLKFIDVGGKFIQADERIRRMAEAERRAKIKVRRATEKKANVR
ncbi:eukaryotic mitochondrial regulator protein-domain-containing protein [Collybia nuda]|uniref:Eukaryotic mitochondrial regulator protein-domain-containing protein n=1 Tax=Collybia nuda TaxID=64659 RepID=A0A9P5YLF6_9AGAR|nr:eukaryotic mitochondrial regulator protein-domain-containing protein [Collybia nuda]